jgi:hypothetical protein
MRCYRFWMVEDMHLLGWLIYDLLLLHCLKVADEDAFL